jgi:hypothetical protein
MSDVHLLLLLLLLLSLNNVNNNLKPASLLLRPFLFLLGELGGNLEFRREKVLQKSILCKNRGTRWPTKEGPDHFIGRQ